MPSAAVLGSRRTRSFGSLQGGHDRERQWWLSGAHGGRITPERAWDGRPEVPPWAWRNGVRKNIAFDKWKHVSSPKLARVASTVLVYLSRGCLRVVPYRESGEKFSRFIREDDLGVRRQKSARAVGRLQTSEGQYLSSVIKVGRETRRESG